MRTRRQAILLLMAVAIVFLMAACGLAGEPMEAVVMEEYGALDWLVAPVPVDPEINTFTMIILPKSDVPEDTELHLGDTVRIRYTGGILEKGPAEFGEILSVEKI